MTIVKTKFLLADDDLDDASLFCEALSDIDPALKCHTVENGRQVFEFLSHQINRPDVIFLDINMPIMNGWDCLRKLKEDSGFKNIPTIMYSTSSAKKDIEMAYGLGAFAFLSKPEEFHELSNILKTVAITPQDSLIQHLSTFKSMK